MSLKEKIETGQFVVLGELEPPKGTDFSHMVAHANRVRNRLDAFVVPEMANAVMKASSLGGCACLNREGLEPVFQACCRDRNRLALQADILAAGGLGIDNIMVVPGEEIAFGDHPRARAVHDLSLTQALEMIRSLCSGKDMSGIDLQGTPDFLVGSNLNAGVTGGALDLELEELSSKIDLGVRFVITTPVFDLDRFEKLLKRLDRQKIAVIPTVLLLKSAGMARYIDRNIPHISIPSDMIQSIQKASDKLKRCVEIAGELIAGLKAMEVGGVMISTIGWEDKLPLVLDQARLGCPRGSRNCPNGQTSFNRNIDHLGRERKQGAMSEKQYKKSGSVMVVGGGIAGMQSALDLANSGYYVYLVEQSSAIGGIMSELDKTFPTNDCAM